MKFKFLALAVAFIMLCGCSTKQKVSPMLRGISFEADISYYNEKYVCDAVVDSDGKLTMEFKYPEDISGLKIFFEYGKANVEYMGLTYTPKDKGMPTGSVAQALHNVLSSVEDEDSFAVKDGENCIIEGRYNETYFKLYLSPSGLPLSIFIPDDSYKIQFNNLAILEKDKTKNN